MSAIASLIPTLAPDPSLFDETRQTVIIYGQITLSGNYGPGVNGHGDILDLSQLGIPSASLPIFVDIWESPAAGTAPNGYIFTYCPGSAQNNGVMTIFNNLAEYTPNSAYSAGLLAAVLHFQATFPAFH